MHKWVLFTLFLVACATAVVVTFNEALKFEEHAEGEPAGENVLNVTAKSFEFNQAEYTAVSDKPIKISFRNEPGGGIHGLAIEGTDVNLENGESVEITLASGTYKMYCSISCGTGHDVMTSTLIVE